MGLFNRKQRIKTLLAQLRYIEAGLQRTIDDSNYILPPHEFYCLLDMRAVLPDVAALAEKAEKLCSKRITAWQNTPYTSTQQFRRNIIAFIGWWFAGTLAIWQTILGWFTPLFPEPWHALATSAAIALVIIVIFARCEQKRR